MIINIIYNFKAYVHNFFDKLYWFCEEVSLPL